MDSKSEYWVNTAQYDLETARVMVNGKRYLYVGFLCHLTIEKALKAVIAQQETPPKVHDLVKLAKQGGIYSEMSDEQKDFLEVLLPLNIEARYPSYKDEVAKALNEAKCRKFIGETEELMCWIIERL